MYPFCCCETLRNYYDSVIQIQGTNELFFAPCFLFSEESKPGSDLDEPWIMTVKGLHNFHNNMKAMEESVMMREQQQQQQNGSNNNVYKGGNQQQQQQQPRTPTSPNAAITTTTIDNNFSRKQQEQPSKQQHHIETISSEINPGLVQLREKANAAAAAYERQDRERELQRSNSQEEAAREAREKRVSKEVS